MTHRERFFAVLENRPFDRVPFFPDITDWYKARRTPAGEPQRFATGQMIFDDDAFHAGQVDMPEEYRDFTLLDFHRHFDWGCPIHAYEAISAEYDAVTIRAAREGTRRHQIVATPAGVLHTVWGAASSGSESIIQHPVRKADDVAALDFLASHTHYRGNPEAVRRILSVLGEQGVLDIPIGRTPFGLLVQELVGYANLAYWLADDPASVHRMIDALAPGFWERVALACDLPARIAIITDHADEHLISPRWFREYCLPYYREATARLAGAGKLVSTHLDGNIKSLLGLLPQAGFDLLDGCTPEPMGNYVPEDLAGILGPDLKAYCGVPSTLFCTRTPTDEIVAHARRIVDALHPNLILNVGDVLPPDGDIGQVVALGRLAAGARPCPSNP